MIQLFLISLLSLLSFFTFGQNEDSTLYKSGYAGGYLIVPVDKSWKIDHAFVSDGTAYSIKVSNENFELIYKAGDTIKLPYYIAEMELLSSKEMVQYQLYIQQE